MSSICPSPLPKTINRGSAKCISPTTRTSISTGAHCRPGNIVKQFGLGEVPTGVYFQGTAQVLESGPELTKAYDVITKRFALGPEILEQAKDPDNNHFFRVKVSDWFMFGKFDTPKPEKYHLEWGRS
jgi:hypothetical protein